MFGQARLLPLCLGHCRGDKGASDRRLPSSQEGGRAGVAGRVGFQMKLCAWGLGRLRPHSCVSVCSACEAPYLVSQPPGDRSGLTVLPGSEGALSSSELLFSIISLSCRSYAGCPPRRGWERRHGAGVPHSWVCVLALLPSSCVLYLTSGHLFDLSVSSCIQ